MRWQAKKLHGGAAWQIVNADGQAVAFIFTRLGPEEDEYNAHLMADAPALSAACRSVLDELEDIYDGAPDSTTLWMGRHIKALRAALRLA